MQAEVDCAAVHLILGGPRSREYSAVRQLPPSARAVVLSSGALSERELRIAVNEKANAISDRRALDTVTNFSTIVGDLLDAGLSSVAVYTDRAHWCRAAAVGHIILGARGIRCSTFAVEEASSSESWIRILRDVGRALCYVVTGFDGRSFAARAHPSRAEDVQNWSASRCDNGGESAFVLSRWLQAAVLLHLRPLRGHEDETAWRCYVDAHEEEIGGSRCFAFAGLREEHKRLPCGELAATLEAEARGEGLPKGWIPSTVLIAVLPDGTIVGHLSIRHWLIPPLEVRGNHIGYILAPRYRKQGHGTRMLALALPRARDLTGKAVLRLDCDAANVASRRIIGSNGGRLIEPPEGGLAESLYFEVRVGAPC